MTRYATAEKTYDCARVGCDVTHTEREAWTNHYTERDNGTYRLLQCPSCKYTLGWVSEAELDAYRNRAAVYTAGI